MKRLLLSGVIAAGLIVPTTYAFAAKAKKAESEVDKALKQAYPDAQTSITGSSDVNGVKVSDVSVKTKNGESTAQITEYGDFLMYGVPHEYSNIRSSIQQDVGGVFKSTPEDVQMYRVTNYFVDFKNPKGKPFTARFDAVGRLLDIENAEAAKAKGQSGDSAAANRGQRITDDKAVRQVADYVKRELPEAKLEAVYPASEQGADFMVATLAGGGEVIVNKSGQIYSLRQPITKEDFPEPVAKTIQGIFTAPIDKLYRGEYEYYQFNQQSQQGTPIVIKMRPNGDILEVQNTDAIKGEEAVTAKSKTKASAGAAKKG